MVATDPQERWDPLRLALDRGGAKTFVWNPYWHEGGRKTFVWDPSNAFEKPSTSYAVNLTRMDMDWAPRRQLFTCSRNVANSIPNPHGRLLGKCCLVLQTFSALRFSSYRLCCLSVRRPPALPILFPRFCSSSVVIPPRAQNTTPEKPRSFGSCLGAVLLVVGIPLYIVLGQMLMHADCIRL